MIIPVMDGRELIESISLLLIPQIWGNTKHLMKKTFPVFIFIGTLGKSFEFSATVGVYKRLNQYQKLKLVL